MTRRKGSTRKRPPEGTLLQRVFRVLRHVSASPPAIAQMLDAAPESVALACLQLYRARKLDRRSAPYTVAGKPCTRHHKTKAGTVVAVVAIPRSRPLFYMARPAAREPRDARGTRPGSHQPTRAQVFAAWLRMMQKKHGPKWRYKPAAHPLDNWRSPQ